jgi:ABC-2 type transport system permease protein
MRFVFLSALKDLRRMRRDPMALVTWVGSPLLIALLLVAFFGHESPKPQGLVMIADQDKTLISAMVMHLYTQDKLGEMLTVQQVPLAEGRRRINSGDGSALVIIPKGFTEAVFGRRSAKLQLVTNPSQSILPEIAKSVTSILVEGAWRLQQLMGDDLNRFDKDKPPSDEDIAAVSVRYSHLFTDLRKYLDPPVIKVDVEEVKPNPGLIQTNIGAVMFPSMTFMAVLFLAAGLAGDIWKEKMAGTLRHIAVTPASVAGFLGGKILALWAIFALVGIVSLLSGKLLIRAEIHRPIIAVLWIAASGGALYLLFALLHTTFKSQRGATMLSSLLMMMLGMLGGCFFPFEIMPDSLAAAGRWMPNGWALLRFRDILAGQPDPLKLTTVFGIVVVLTILLFAVVTRRLRWKFLN